MNWGSKWAIVKTTASEDHAEHTAWGLCRDTVSSQGLISPALSFHPHFTLLVKGQSQPASPPHSLTDKRAHSLLCAYNYTSAHTLYLYISS